MKIIIVGATGTVGKPVTKELKKRHEVITVGSSSGDIQMDITSKESIKEMYKEVGEFDALVVAAGAASMKPLSELTEEDFYIGIKSKMMGQINLVMEGKDLINDNGSFTLITGILAEDPVRGSVAMGFLNGALNSFAIAVACELERGIRINTVSPGLVEDSSESYGPYFPGHTAVSMQRVADAYTKSVEGIRTGEIIKIY